uniref:Uncharacterized protein n=1 Tax=Anguilla anguilla TaxID=7936 RepID=A0A0E9U331_ANGAN
MLLSSSSSLQDVPRSYLILHYITLCIYSVQYILCI